MSTRHYENKSLENFQILFNQLRQLQTFENVGKN